MRRHKILFGGGGGTHVAQKSEMELNDKMHSFLRYVIAMRWGKSYDLGSIVNMDETPVWIDMPGDYTLETKGSKTVTIGSTGHEKTRITVCLTAMADGSNSYHSYFSKAFCHRKTYQHAPLSK